MAGKPNDNYFERITLGGEDMTRNYYRELDEEEAPLQVLEKFCSTNL